MNFCCELFFERIHLTQNKVVKLKIDNGQQKYPPALTVQYFLL